MRKLEGQELKKAINYLEKASEIALSSTCNKTHRGVIIVKNDEIIGKGYNGPPEGYVCGWGTKYETCNRTDIHAEIRAIQDTLRNNPEKIEGSTLYHIKVENGKIKPSRKPSCPDCSGNIVENKIALVVLYHLKEVHGEEGVYEYIAKEFHDRSLEVLLK